MKVLLVQPPVEDFYITAQRLQPTGLLYLGSYLSGLGHEVRILELLSPARRTPVPPDPDLRHLEPLREKDRTGLLKAYSRFGARPEEIRRLAGQEEFAVCGISANFAAYASTALETARIVKELRPKAFLVIGGNAAPVCAEYFLSSGCVDAVIFGEGESTIVSLLERLKSSRDMTGIENIAFIQNGTMIRSPQYANFDIDKSSLEPGLLDHARYRVGKRKTLSFVTSRGCPFRCSYCTAGLNTLSPPRRQSPDPLWTSLERYREAEGIGAFNIEDENFTSERIWAQGFLERKIAEAPGLRLYLMNGLDYRFLDDELLGLLRRADLKNLGLALVDAGAEASVLERPTSWGKFRDVVRSAKRLGFSVTSYLIAGLPGQTRQGIEESVRELWSLGSVIGLSPYYEIPGTRLWEERGRIRIPFAAMRGTALLSASGHLSSADILDLLGFCREGNLEQVKNK